jgi:hypothetical protein
MKMDKNPISTSTTLAFAKAYNVALDGVSKMKVGSPDGPCAVNKPEPSVTSAVKVSDSKMTDDSCSSNESSYGFAKAIARMYRKENKNPLEDPKTPKGRKRSSSPKPPQDRKINPKTE